MKHSRRYYQVRSVVRFTFWTSVVTSGIFIAGAISEIGQKPECPISLNIDFTYQVQQPYDPETCDLPPNVSLGDSGRWRWTQ